MRKRVYTKENRVQFLLANWPEDIVTYRQLQAYCERHGLEIKTNVIVRVVANFRHVELVETSRRNGTTIVTISKDLRRLKFPEDIGMEKPDIETIKDVTPTKNLEERRLNKEDPNIKYSFAIRCVIAAFSPHVTFSYHDIEKALLKRSIYPGGTSNQIQPYLSKLYLKNLIDRVKRGQPSLFRLKPEFLDFFRIERYTMIDTFPEFKTHYETNFAEKPAPEETVIESKPETASEPQTAADVLPEGMTPADFGYSMFEYMLELRNGKRVVEVDRLRAKLEDTQMRVHNLHLEIGKQKTLIRKLNDIKQRDEETIKELTSALNASHNEVAIAQNRKKTFSMRDVVTIKGQRRDNDSQPSNSVAFKFGN